MKNYILITTILCISANNTQYAENKPQSIQNTVQKDDMQTQIQPGQIWQHYKGNNYRIVAISCHSEDLSWYVVYETLYDNKVSKIWHRPLDMFVETIEIDGKLVPRFKHVE